APHILVFAGSLRAGSMNRQLAAASAAAVEAAGGTAELLELADYPMPMYDEDEETRSGLPEPVRAFKAKVVAAPGYIICSPEYNGSLAPLLKNALDWLSRQGDDPRPRAAYDGKVVGLMAASNGALGGLRGLVHLRQIVNNLGAHVHPEQFALKHAASAFDGDGRLSDPQNQAMVARVAGGVVDLARRLAS
ncbi:MAG: NADPH-dependent FMN reductase, partial [Thalassobaculaceae bacterium]